MTDKPRLLGISGSLRAASTNTKLVHEAVRAFGPCEFIFANIHFPLFDADLQESKGVPVEVQTLAEQALSADAIVISTPEYNKNLPGGLKNALDWLSRSKTPPLKDKPIAIVSAAAGISGGARAQYSLRHCLTPFMCRVLPGPEVMIGNCSKAFDEDGKLIDPVSFDFLEKLMQALRSDIGRYG